jgi:hypothetical protein
VDDGSARLLDLGGEFHALPETGAEMLKGVLEKGVAATVRDLSAQYDADEALEQRIAADLKALVERLKNLRLIHHRQTERTPKSQRGLISLLLHLWLRWVLRGRRPWNRKAARLMTLARLSFWCWGWAGTVARWRQCLPAVDQAPSAARQEELAQAIDGAVRESAASHVLQMACKERGLVCWTLLRSAGVPAKLVVGLDLYPLAGHCWCELGNRAFSDFPDRCESFTPVVRYE